MENGQAPNVEKTSRAAATMIVGAGIAVVGMLVRAWGQGLAEGSTRAAEIIGGAYDGSGSLTILVGLALVAVGVLIAAGGLVGKLVSMLSD